jgi:hypothetical protein
MYEKKNVCMQTNKKHPMINSHKVLNLHFMVWNFFWSHVICMVAGGLTQEEKYTQHIQHGGAMRIFLWEFFLNGK